MMMRALSIKVFFSSQNVLKKGYWKPQKDQALTIHEKNEMKMILSMSRLQILDSQSSSRLLAVCAVRRAHAHVGSMMADPGVVRTVSLRVLGPSLAWFKTNMTCCWWKDTSFKKKENGSISGQPRYVVSTYIASSWSELVLSSKQAIFEKCYFSVNNQSYSM